MRALFKDPDVIRTFNVGLIITLFLLVGLGLMTLYSATKGPGSLHRSQLFWFLISLSIGVILIFIDTPLLEKLAYVSYAACLLLLSLVLMIGKIGGGAQRWIGLGGIHIQPSEFSKIAIAFTLAKYFSDDRGGAPYTLKRLVVPLIIVLPFFILTLLQPDLGTAGVLLLIATSIFIFVGVDWRSIIIVGVISVITVPVAYRFVLHDYQRERVKTFLDPGRDAQGSGYNALQSRIAVGSGKFFGKGYLQGTQSQLNFIPEQHTDFIFSVFAEEWGFVGAGVLLLLYSFYIFFALRTVIRARDKFESFLAFGLTCVLFWQVFINLGMVSGILPIVGVGLPFFSYGGSSLVTFVVSTALLLNLGRKRYIF